MLSTTDGSSTKIYFLKCKYNSQNFLSEIKDKQMRSPSLHSGPKIRTAYFEASNPKDWFHSPPSKSALQIFGPDKSDGLLILLSLLCSNISGGKNHHKMILLFLSFRLRMVCMLCWIVGTRTKVIIYLLFRFLVFLL